MALNALMIWKVLIMMNILWVSADGVYLVIKEGKIIKTHGLPNNLLKIKYHHLRWKGKKPLI